MLENGHNHVKNIAASAHLLLRYCKYAMAGCIAFKDLHRKTETVLTDSEIPCDLVVSIINYRTAQMTMDCVASVLADLAQSPEINAHVVVVDNASGDGSAEALGAWHAGLGPQAPVSLVLSKDNSGFSGGHNQGITARKGRYYLVLNSDAVLHSGFCRAILTAAEAAPEVGLFTPRIEYDDGTAQISRFRIPSPASEMIRAAATGAVSRALKSYVVAPADPLRDAQIGWASFACILLRGEMIDTIGLMDEGYFLYFEDTEYCLRARRAGWGISYVPDARIEHFRGGSAPVKGLAKARKRLPAYYYASRTRLFYQAHGRAGLLAANLAWYLGRAIALSRRLIGRANNYRPVAHEARDIWINFARPLGDRRAAKD